MAAFFYSNQILHQFCGWGLHDFNLIFDVNYLLFFSANFIWSHPVFFFTLHFVICMKFKKQPKYKTICYFVARQTCEKQIPGLK